MTLFRKITKPFIIVFIHIKRRTPEGLLYILYTGLAVAMLDLFITIKTTNNLPQLALSGAYIIISIAFVAHIKSNKHLIRGLIFQIDTLCTINKDMIKAAGVIQQDNYRRFFNDTIATDFLIWAITNYIPIQEGTGAFLDREDPTRDPISANQLLIIFKATKICEPTSPDA